MPTPSGSGTRGVKPGAARQYLSFSIPDGVYANGGPATVYAARASAAFQEFYRGRASAEELNRAE